MALAPVAKARPLTSRERAFLAIYFANGMFAGPAWYELCKQLGKPCTEGAASVAGARAMKRIRASGDFRAILEERNLDDVRLASEIDRLLKVKKTYVSNSGQTVEYDDGQTQVRAAEMLKDVLGHSSKTEINLTTDLPAIIFETAAEGDAR